ncbi:signal peptidase I [Paenibacillus methanolicus]|uniref:Signal peptidase I n=1 Tax=Paenibacillus methanolicus TaxID=582686 RepID=A0A5S5CHH8_9BACL|nr:signal peptidase I [Paenibacillus methanolicus]TYP77676.1 signal peptidase I [Paenibacillus methanolicus]
MDHQSGKHEDGEDRTNTDNSQLEQSRHKNELNEHSTIPERSKGSKARSEIAEWVKALAIAALLVLVIRWFLFAPFIVEGQSMEPNFYTSERLIVNKIIYDIRAPKHGEVIVFEVPDQGRDFIKRVIGVPGDKIKYEGDDLYINGEKVEEPYLAEAIAAAKARGELYNTREGFPNDTVTEDTVPEGTVLAFGDNRSHSQDSRMIGFVQYDRIVGRADFIFWPLDKLQFVKHG